MSLRDMLRDVEVFADAPDDVLDVLAAAATQRFVAADTFLYRQGDVADSLAVVESGRLEIFFEGDPLRVAGRARRGDVLGELSLLTGGVRAASVRATRDAVVHVITKDAFEPIVAANGALALAIARNLGGRLRVSATVDVPQHSPRVFALLAVDTDADAAPFARALADHLGPTAQIVTSFDLPAEDTARSEWLDRTERAGATVVFVAGIERAWTDFCLRSADRIVLVSRGAPTRTARDNAALRGRALVVEDTHITRARLATALRTLEPASLHLVRPSAHDSDTRRAARRLTARALGLVLSGGGARGLAHLGVLDELASAGVAIDRIGGCSMGSLVGALAAMEWSPARISGTIRTELVEKFGESRVSRLALVRGQRVRALLQRVFGDLRIEELPIPFFCVSADLVSGELVTHRQGAVADAVAASMAIPGVFPPVRSGHRWLADGGILDNLPVDVMAADGEGPVVAVDVMRGAGPVGGSKPVPSRLDAVVRSTLIASWGRAAQNRLAADVVVAPEVSHVGMLEFGRMDAAVSAGRRATTEKLDAIRGLVAPR